MRLAGKIRRRLENDTCADRARTEISRDLQARYWAAAMDAKDRSEFDCSTGSSAARAYSGCFERAQAKAITGPGERLFGVSVERLL